jgi:ankyrin repeat protein
MAMVLFGAARAGAAGTSEVRLIQAVRGGDLDQVRQLIQRKADVNERHPDGSTALHWAVNAEDSRMTSLLLSAGAKVDMVNEYGVAPLSIAVSGRSVEIVESLLAAGANPNTALPTGETALMTSARTGLTGAVRALLARGADPNAKENVMGQTALMWALVERHDAAAHALMDGGSDLRARTNGGFTPFLFAVREGRGDMARLLLERGADVNDTAKDGSSALHVAVLRGHLALAKELLGRGADPNAAKCGFTVLHWVAGTWETIHSHDYIFNQTAVNRVQEWAVLGGVTDQAAKHDLIKALLSRGADINARAAKIPPRFGFTLFKGNLILGATAFYIASVVSDIPTMKLLLEHGADPTIAAADGTTPLIVAAGLARVPNETRVPESRVIEAVKLLLTLKNDIRASNINGTTPLHAAAMAGLDDVTRFLVEQGAPINAKNKNGETPYKMATGYEDTALFHEHPSTAAVLKSLGGTE